jgi:hypothetical protein
MEAVTGGTKSLADALTKRIAPLSTLAVVSRNALAWSPLIIGVDMTAAPKLGAVTKYLQFRDENVFTIWSFLWKQRSLIKVQNGKIDKGSGFFRLGIFLHGGAATAVQE